jgi:hypothetical protein
LLLLLVLSPADWCWWRALLPAAAAPAGTSAGHLQAQAWQQQQQQQQDNMSRGVLVWKPSSR